MPVTGSSPHSCSSPPRTLRSLVAGTRTPDRASPAPSRTPYASCSLPVPCRTGTRPRPTTPERTAAAGAWASGAASSASSAHGATTATAHRGGERDDHQRRVERAGAPVAEHDRQGALAGVDVGRDVAQVVGHQDRARQRPAADPAGEGRPGQPLGLDVRRPEHGDEPEEHEDGDLAEPAVAVRPARAGVGPGGGDRRRPHEQEPPRRERRQDAVRRRRRRAKQPSAAA